MGKAGIRGARCLEGECYDNGSPVPSFTAHPSFEKLWMTTLVNDAKEVNHISFHCVIQVKGKRLGAPAREAVWTGMIATLPSDNLAHLPGYTLAKCAGKAV